MKITRKKLAKGTGAAFYALAAAVLVFYFRLSLDPMWTVLPPGRVVLLLAACLLMYVGGRLIAGTLPERHRLIPYKANLAIWFGLYLLLLATLTLFDSYFGRIRCIRHILCLHCLHEFLPFSRVSRRFANTLLYHRYAFFAISYK